MSGSWSAGFSLLRPQIWQPEGCIPVFLQSPVTWTVDEHQWTSPVSEDVYSIDNAQVQKVPLLHCTFPWQGLPVAWAMMFALVSMMAF